MLSSKVASGIKYTTLLDLPMYKAPNFLGPVEKSKTKLILDLVSKCLDLSLIKFQLHSLINSI